MMTNPSDVPPILVVYFNRPDVLRRNLEALSLIAPKQLFFSCDAPRCNVPDDLVRVAECRRIVEEVVDWDCSVETLFAGRNYGCDAWVPKAISWFFSKVDAGIILEDDCIIDWGFVNFAAELLKRYKDEPRVMNISAANFQTQKWGKADYYFSIYPANWAWASWARAWTAFQDEFEMTTDVDRKLWPHIPCGTERRYWLRFYRAICIGKCTFWDAKWLFAIWKNQGVSITPNINLVKNIGFGEDATHTKRIEDVGIMEIAEVSAILNHPEEISVCVRADRFLFIKRYKPRWIPRIKSGFSKFLGSVKKK